MAPTPDEPHCEQLHHVDEKLVLSDDDVVISGVSTVLPNSHNIMEFADQLYAKENFLKKSSPRWKYKKSELTNHHGIIPDLDRFDAQFFMVSHQLSLNMDPMTRKLLEHSYQALFDAGISPSELSEKPIGVFVTTGVSEAETTFHTFNRYHGIVGCNRAMCANRVSYYLNLKGPSVMVDGEAAGSAAALRKAHQAILTGQCDAALVGGASLVQQPQTPLNYHKLVQANHDGNIKSYDMNADGHTLSEGVVVIFLQRHKHARRVYASVRHIDLGFAGSTREGQGQAFGVHRDPAVLTKFLRDFYKDAQVSPSQVEYVEGNGAAVRNADEAELNVIDEIFCKDRVNPLAVGSVVSNVGFTHATSCLTSLVKLILAYYKGSIAANINCENPRVDVAGISEGRLRILTEHAPFQRTFTSINNFSITGVNAHVLLQGEYRPKNLSKYHTDIPQLVLASGRQESGVQRVLDDIKTRPLDPEEIALLRNFYRLRIPKHLARGYGIYTMNDDKETQVLHEKADYYDELKPPLFFVYSGMGSQWIGMGTQLMRIPVFAAAIERCHKALQPKGINLTQIITSTDKSTFDNILNSFVGIAAIQIGLTDILKTIGLVPDYIIGHSVGELGCAYADGCLTAEEMILMAYSRGLVSVQTPFIRGSMAAVGIGYKQVKNMVPPEIEVACHNGPESSTISGPAEVMKEFVATLTSRGIFAKEVPCSNIAYHSRYISEAGPSLLNLLKTVVSKPIARSKRWLSTSIPQEKWNEPLATYSSAEYHTNNLLSPVLFEEVLPLVPRNAVLVEVAPHGLLQAILKRSLPESCRHVPLTRRGHSDNALFLLDAIGKLYMAGFDIDVTPLYPKIKFPVSTETRPLSQLVEWAYFEKMKTCNFIDLKGTKLAVYKPIIFTYDEDYEYLKGNVIDGKRVFPFAGALVLAWDTLAMTLGHRRQHISVKFLDITFHTQPYLADDRALHLTIMLQRGSGRFEVSFEQGLVADGYIAESETIVSLPNNLMMAPDDGVLNLTNDDVYKVFYERGYQYRNQFRSIQRANMNLNRAQLAWNRNWVTFIDGALQLNALRRDHKEISQLRHIKHLQINVNEQSREKNVVDVTVSKIHGITKCGGLVIKHNIVFKDKPLMSRQTAALKVLKPGTNDQEQNCVTWGRKGIFQLQDKKTLEPTMALEIAQFGDLNTLEWVECPPLTEKGIPVKVHYAGLNGYDTKRATAELSIDNQTCRRFGMDFSGTTERGDRVMGLIRGGAVCSKVNAHPELLWPVPDHWTMEEAATVPMAYCLAFYGLAIKNEIYSKMNVLIHGGAGALGQAAISICLASGCNVFTTVGDIRKKVFLLKMFPGLKAENIGNSRDGTFMDMIKSACKGDGCELVVINSTANHLKQETFNCCAAFGITVDIVSPYSQDNFIFGMYNLTDARNYSAIDFSLIFNDSKSEDMKRLQVMVSEGIARGYVSPLSRVTYCARDAPRALRLLAASRHRGRVLLNLRDSIPATRTRIPHSINSSHLIFCDKSDLGIHLADKLVSNGAKNIYVHRSQSSTYLQYKIRSWQKLGVRVNASYENIEGIESVDKFINDCKKLAPVEGIYVINVEVTDPTPADELKTLVTSLDVLSKKLDSALRYFAVIHTNDFEYELCLRKIQAGLPVLYIRLPNLEKFDCHGSYSQGINDDDVLKIRSAVECIEQALITGKPVVSAYVQPEEQRSFLEYIAKIAGINILEATSDLTLEKIGVDEGKAQELSNILENYNITIPKENVPQTTVAELINIHSELHKSNPQLSGLSAYFNFIDGYELELANEIVLKATLVNTSDMCPVTFESELTYLCIVPGIEGHHRRFDTLCEKLRLPALVLQPGVDIIDKTVEDMAQRLVDVMLRKLELKNNFYLLGYELGVLVALEMAAILEKRGLTGVVYCLGGGPEDICATFKTEFGNINPEELQNQIISHVYTLLSQSKSEKLENELKQLREFEEKVKTCVKMLRVCCSLSKDYIHAIINVTYTRIMMACKYVNKHREFRSKIIVLKAESITGPPVDNSQTIVHQIGTNLSFASEDLRCAAIVNKYMDTDVLDENFSKNLCDTTHIDTLQKVQFYFSDDILHSTSEHLSSYF